MISLHTERLVILAVPHDLAVPDPSEKSNLRNLLAFERRLAASETGKSVNRGPQRIPVGPNARCICVIKGTEQEIGVVSTTWSPRAGIVYFGYSIAEKYRGQGYATEAVQAVLEWLLAMPEVKGVMAETYADWSGSIRVMEKVGLSKVDVELGPNVVRYAFVKPGCAADLGEGEYLTLLTYRYPRKDLVGNSIKWQLSRPRELIPLIAVGFVAYKYSDSPWSGVAVIALIGYGGYLVRRVLAAAKQELPEVTIQFRSSGLLYADRNGIGYSIPWKRFPSFRLPATGGIELQNGAAWFHIPQQAFLDSSISRAQAFLESHGVKKG